MAGWRRVRRREASSCCRCSPPPPALGPLLVGQLPGRDPCLLPLRAPAGVAREHLVRAGSCTAAQGHDGGAGGPRPETPLLLSHVGALAGAAGRAHPGHHLRPLLPHPCVRVSPGGSSRCSSLHTWSTTVSHPGTQTTMTTLAFIMFDGAGGAVGGWVAGRLYQVPSQTTSTHPAIPHHFHTPLCILHAQDLGGSLTYRVFGVASLVAAAITLLLQRRLARKEGAKVAMC